MSARVNYGWATCGKCGRKLICRVHAGVESFTRIMDCRDCGATWHTITPKAKTP